MTLPKPMTSSAKSDGRFGKQDFVYLPEKDAYRCPAGEQLPYRFTGEEDGKRIRRYWTTACQNCSLKSHCTTGPERRIPRWEHEHLLDAVQQRLDANPQAMRQRRETVEHPFGTMKARMGATHFLTKTLPKVAAEMALSVLAYNLTRVHEHHRHQATDRCDRGLRPIRSWLLTGFPSNSVFTRPRPEGDIARRNGSPRVFAIAAVQLNRFAMRGTEIGFRPRLFSFAHRFAISEPLLDDKPFQRGKPVSIITRAVIGFAALRRSLEFGSERLCPLGPGEMALLGELDSERKCLRLPWLGEDGASIAARKPRKCS